MKITPKIPRQKILDICGILDVDPEKVLEITVYPNDVWVTERTDTGPETRIIGIEDKVNG